MGEKDMDVSKLKELLEKATPGPWRLSGRCGSGEGFYWVSAEPSLSLSVSPRADGFVYGQNERNAALIALAPTLAQSVLSLTEENRRLREALKVAREYVEDAHDHMEETDAEDGEIQRDMALIDSALSPSSGTEVR